MEIRKIDSVNCKQNFGVQVGNKTVKAFEDMIQSGLATRKFGETAVNGQRDVFQKAVNELAKLGHPETKIDINPKAPWEFVVSNSAWSKKKVIYNEGSFTQGQGPAMISERLLAVAKPETVAKMEALLR